jgi:hypothetical protein
MTDQQIATLQPNLEYTPQQYSLPTPDGRPVRWTLEGQPSPFGQGLRMLFVSDLVVLDIITANAQTGWQRPIYFSATVAESSELGLQPFLQNEGLARRVMPFSTGGDSDGRVDPTVFRERLAAYRFRNLTDSTIYYDENARGLADVYNRTLGTVATQLAVDGDTALARATIERLTTEVSPRAIPPSFFSSVVVAQARGSIGDHAGMAETIAPAEREALNMLRAARTEEQQSRALQYVQILQSTYLQAGAYEAASAFYSQLATIVGDPTLRLTPDQVREQAEAMRAGQPPAETPVEGPDSGGAPG